MGEVAKQAIAALPSERQKARGDMTDGRLKAERDGGAQISPACE